MYTSIKAYYKELIPAMTDAEWEGLEKLLVLKKLKKGELLIREGEVCNYVSFINKGMMRIYINAVKQEVSLGFIGQNDYLSSYVSFLTRKPSHENIEALEDTEVLNLSYNSMQKLYKEFPIYEIVGRKIAENLFIMVSLRTNALLLLSPEERYNEMIENSPMLLQQLPQYMLASFIGITPRHLSRIRANQLKKKK